ncbi:MAG: hypothetical protein H7Y11_03470, partial [Armatimonadetes bacterium]|nr:hypothetical protein [Anaerolineae bacterium]
MRKIAPLLIYLLLLTVVSAPHAAQAGLLRPVTPPADDRVQACRSSIPRSAYAAVDFALLTAPTLTLNLFDDLTLSAVQTGNAPRPSGLPGSIWLGRLSDYDYSSVVLAIDPVTQRINGRISVPGYRYSITPVFSAPGVHRIEQIELGTSPQLPLGSAASGLGLESSLIPLPAAPGSRADDGSQIDLMVAYTPAAVSILERVVGDVDLAIDNAVAFTNQVLSDSAVNTQLRLVHTQAVFYLEQPNVDFDADLNHLMGKSDGWMDELHPLRDQYQADLVALITGTWFASYRGNAPAPAPLSEARGFSVTEGCNIQDETFTQMIGYNLGSSTDAANTPPGENPVQAYGYDYQDPPTGGGDLGDFVTIMASRTGGSCPPIVTANQCPVIERFSNPNQSFGGKPSGSADADNARSINELRVTVANYRDSTAGGTPTPTVTPGGATPTPTSTPVPVTLLINGGFEIDADNDTVPDFWSGRNVGVGDARTCGGIGDGSTCAFTLTGAVDENSRLQQTISGAGLNVGATVTLSGAIKADNGSSGAQLK